jgi:hypothetical protein
MRRFALAAAASVAIGLLAAPAGAQLPTEDSVTGIAATGAGRSFVEFTFDAHSGPSGENPTGTVRFDAFLADLGQLEVSCLTVSDNRASVVVLIPPLSPNAPAGALISVQDNDGAGADRLGWRSSTCCRRTVRLQPTSASRWSEGISPLPTRRRSRPRKTSASTAAGG